MRRRRKRENGICIWDVDTRLDHRDSHSRNTQSINSTHASRNALGKEGEEEKEEKSKTTNHTYDFIQKNKTGSYCQLCRSSAFRFENPAHLRNLRTGLALAILIGWIRSCLVSRSSLIPSPFFSWVSLSPSPSFLLCRFVPAIMYFLYLCSSSFFFS